MVVYIPKRGDIIWLEFEPQKGKEIQKRRPALIISPQEYNKKVGLAICIPITSKIKGYPFEVNFNFNNQDGVILSDQLRSLDWKARKAKFIVECPEVVLVEVIKKITLLIEF